jgi:quinol monooxygenase YgiN
LRREQDICAGRPAQEAEHEVADFLRSAVPLVNAEVGTVSWFAIQEGPSSFAIFDTFDDEAGREAHLNGKAEPR